MPYTPTNWQNNPPSTATPLSAENLNKLETQYSQAVADAAFDATTKANTAQSNAAIDATTKANNAQSNAATDATTKANNARAAAIADAATKYQTVSGLDGTVASLVGSGTSSTRVALNGQFSKLNDASLSITSIQKTHSSGAPYIVTRLWTGGRFIPGVAKKVYGGDFDATGSPYGSTFVPPREDLSSYAKRTGNVFASNASGWRVEGSNPGEIRGAQIKNGIAYHDFDVVSGVPQGSEAMAVMADGRFKGFSAREGATVSQMVAQGAVSSWSFGPLLVRDGTKVNLDSSYWLGFVTEVSARTIIGQSITGDIIVINVYGQSGVSGIAGNDMCQLAVDEGCYQAACMDGGGSTQAYNSGVYAVRSSDSGGRRAVPDAIMLNGQLSTRALDTNWVNIPLRSGYVATSVSQTPQIRQVDQFIQMRGQVAPSSGTFGSAAAVVADLPLQFRTAQATKIYRSPGDGNTTRKVALLTDYSIQIVGDSTNTPAYIALDQIVTLSDPA